MFRTLKTVLIRASGHPAFGSIAVLIASLFVAVLEGPQVAAPNPQIEAAINEASSVRAAKGGEPSPRRSTTHSVERSRAARRTALPASRALGQPAHSPLPSKPQPPLSTPKPQERAARLDAVNSASGTVR